VPYTFDDFSVHDDERGTLSLFRNSDRRVFVQWRKESQFRLVLTMVDKEIAARMPEFTVYPVEQMIAGAVIAALNGDDA
jgi:hypothetical protein